MKIDKSLIGLAGEYAVASELCRRGFHAQITYGRWKNTDVVAVNLENGKTVLVEVKTKQGKQWPAVKGIKGSNRVQILVDYEGKSLRERPDFYILDEDFWKDYINKIRDKLKEIKEERDQIIPIFPDGYKGVVLSPGDVEARRERWDIIEKKLR